MSLDLTAKTFSLQNARELVLYARMAYEGPPSIRDAGTDTNILITDLGDCVVVACKGTASLRNFVTDCEAVRIGTLIGGVHTGFWDAWLSVSTKVFSYLSNCGGRPVIFTGHSLGGALAMIGAKRCCDSGINIHSVYSFGCPRIGDNRFLNCYERTSIIQSPFGFLRPATFTIINDCDIVPRVPGWLAGFRRPGHDEFISALAPQDIVEDPHFTYRLFSDTVALLNGWAARRNVTFLDELLADHHINKYIAALAEIEPP